MILHAVANEPPSLLARRRVRIGDEGDVARGDGVLHRNRLDRREQLLRPTAEQARARYWREWNCDLQLWIILPACTLPRLRPAVVEHIFTLAVRLEIGRRSGNEMQAFVLDEDGCRRPAGARADTARVFQS